MRAPAKRVIYYLTGDCLQSLRRLGLNTFFDLKMTGAFHKQCVIPVAMRTGIHYSNQHIQAAISCKIGIHITPMRVYLFNQLNFPGSSPLLDALFFGNSVNYIHILAKPNKQGTIVFRGETAQYFIAMLPYTARKISRHARIQRAIFARSHDVNV